MLVAAVATDAVTIVDVDTILMDDGGKDDALQVMVLVGEGACRNSQLPRSSSIQHTRGRTSNDNGEEKAKGD